GRQGPRSGAKAQPTSEEKVRQEGEIKNTDQAPTIRAKILGQVSKLGSIRRKTKGENETTQEAEDRNFTDKYNKKLSSETSADVWFSKRAQRRCEEECCCSRAHRIHQR